ncbi:HEPN domain-containing protein [Niallia taxi]|uniref:ApeA N-terminal domain-containing protein n=1 Tax=Niallia taxi TaxID=2499688 RepID=A0A437K491_9BACI|nr:HEPN domain-containing protein [Niallia taxi]RVT57419.1 hypothetical protein EM808_24650 [Niallia taxi]
MYTGLIRFNDKNCVFKLKNYDLEIEEIENRDEVYINDLESIFNPDKRETISLNVLVGKDFDNGKVMHFNPYKITKTGAKTFCASLSSYIVFDDKESTIEGLKLNSEELNWFHNVEHSYSFTISPENGNSEIKIEPYDRTDKRFSFNIEGQKIEGNLNISRTFSRVSTMPLKLKTDMNLYFKATNNFALIERLSNITFNFLKFVTYRRNITFNQLTLMSKYRDTDKYHKVGTLHIKGFNKDRIEEEKVIQNQLIDLPYLENELGKLFDDLAENKIYLTHIPESHADNNTITPARFILVTAGFEWQFRSTYKELNTESEDKYKELKDEIISFLDEKINQHTGKNKKYFKSHKNLLMKTSMTLADKINWALREFNDELNLFIKSVYEMNGINNYKYSEISERIQNQRNNIAHGNLDKEFNNIVVLDLFVLEWLYYAMVLNSMGVSRSKIKSAINKLFKRGFAV